jgi:hypothetical protein
LYKELQAAFLIKSVVTTASSVSLPKNSSSKYEEMPSTSGGLFSAPKAIADFHPHFFYHSAFFQGHANWAMRNHIDNSNKNPPIANQRLFLECIPHLVSAN